MAVSKSAFLQVRVKYWPATKTVMVLVNINNVESDMEPHERRLFSQDIKEFSCHKKFIKVRREANSNCQGAFLLTARQYGEVVLPDASTGQCSGTLARKLSRCKEGMAHFLPSGYKFC